MEHLLMPCKATIKIDGSKVLVLASHPGDEVFGCGGAILRHVTTGDLLQVIVVANGEYRTNNAQQVIYGELRREESRKAAKTLEYGTPEFWGVPDCGVEYGERLVQRIESAIETLDANLVYAPSIYEMHPDHRALGMAAVEAVRRHATKLKLAMYEVGVPMVQPNVLLDISDLQDRKQAAMAWFASELRNQPCEQHIEALNRFRTHTLTSQVKAAEAYFLADADELKTDVLRVYESEYQRQHKTGMPMVLSDLPLVSVLIRSMDRPLLHEALDSLALQTYANIEVVVINARLEEHRALGQRCGRFPLRIVSTGTSLMRSRAANVGLDSALGDYLMFLDDDDWLAPDHIFRLVEALKNNSSCRVAYAGVEFRDENRGKLELAPFNEPFNAGRLRGGNYIPIHAVLFARTLLSHKVRFDEAFGVYEDWDFLLQLSQFTNFVHVDKVCAYYRASGTSNVGVFADAVIKQQAREQIFGKWKSIWSGTQIEELVTATFDVATKPLALLRNEFDQAVAIGNERQLRLTNMGKTIAYLEKNITEIEKTTVDLEKNMAGMEKTIAELRKEIADRKNIQEKLEDQINEKDRMIQVTAAQMLDVFSSPSWRWSAPIRWVGRLGLGTKLAIKTALRRVLGNAP